MDQLFDYSSFEITSFYFMFGPTLKLALNCEFIAVLFPLLLSLAVSSDFLFSHCSSKSQCRVIL